MKKQIIILGNTEFSEELYQVMSVEGLSVKGFTVDNEYLKSPSFCGLPNYPFEAIQKEVDMETVEIALALGYSEMNNVRKRKYEECKKRHFNVATFCSNKAIVYAKTIGEGCIIMPSAYVGPFARLGICNVLKSGVNLPHHNIIGNYNWFAGCKFGGSAIVGNNCFLGLCTTVRNSIRIADYTFSAANTYLHKDTEAFGVYMGVPAKKTLNKSSMEIIKHV